MADLDDDYVLIESSLSGEFVRDGIRVDVQIYRGEEDTAWVLEVIDQADNSYVWDEQFATDQLAMKAFLASVDMDGMKQYNPYYRRDLN
ncbi:MAG: hypothetical protein JXQ99_16255 [Hyphomicrobiaceae bacterium]